MDEMEMHRIFADELEHNNEPGLANMVRSGGDNSNGGTAAIRAMTKAVSAERERCAEVIQEARETGRETDLRTLIHKIRNP